MDPKYLRIQNCVIHVHEFHFTGCHVTKSHQVTVKHQVTENGNCHWYWPTTLEELLTVLGQLPEGKNL